MYYRISSTGGLFGDDSLRAAVAPVTLPADLSTVTDEQLADFGIARQPAPPVHAAYQWPVWTEAGWVLREKVLAEYQAECVALVKKGAASRIEATGLGWMVEREVSGGDLIPQATKDACAAIRAKSNEVEAAINGAHDHAAVKAAMAFHWPGEEPVTEA